MTSASTPPASLTSTARPPDSQVQPPGVALITGSGAPRVGREIALHLASLGYSIALHANQHRQQAEEVAASLRAAGTPSTVFCGEMQDDAFIESMIAGVVDHFGQLDVLVNSAAIWHPTPLEAVTGAEIRKYFEINSVGTFLAARAAGLRMVQQPRGGCIVNIGDWALVRPYLDHAAYFPSKAAVEAITRSLAVELGHRNPQVRVNCILPGPVLLGDDVPAEKRAEIAAGTLAKRVGTPAHIAHAVQFLVENDFVTGVCLPVDGGRTIFTNDKLQTEYRTG
ncbi:SDR family NAD(P)-dependent oxidoreductase [Planctomycetaceae bacterium SH139]